METHFPLSASTGGLFAFCTQCPDRQSFTDHRISIFSWGKYARDHLSFLVRFGCDIYGPEVAVPLSARPAWVPVLPFLFASEYPPQEPSEPIFVPYEHGCEVDGDNGRMKEGTIGEVCYRRASGASGRLDGEGIKTKLIQFGR